MHFLFLVDNYFPLPLANSICVKSLVECIKKRGHKCTVINRIDDGKQIEDSYEIRNFNCSRSLNFRFPLKTIYKIARLFVYPRIYKPLVNCYYKQMIQMDLHQVDVIVSVCNPIESVLAALKIKEEYPTIQQIVYNLDTLSDFRIRWIEAVCCPSWRKKAFKVEKKIFEKSDIVSFLSSHKNFYLSEKYTDFTEKFLFQEVPLLRIDNEVMVENNKCSVYAGRFYKDFREPRVLLNLFKNTSLALDIYTTNDYCKTIRKNCNVTNNITVHEYIPEDTLNQVMRASKILISIGNKSSKMFPSKIVTYVAMCKPIIHMYHDDIDPVLDYLSNYPDVLFVDLRNSLAKNRALVYEFCAKKHQPINPSMIEEYYKTSTPDYCINEIFDRIKR